MKKLLTLFIFSLLSIIAYSQPGGMWKGVGVVYTRNVPTFTPTDMGSWLAIDTLSGNWYEWDRNRALWQHAGYRIQETNSYGFPNYTPSKQRGKFAINLGDSLFYYRSNWILINDTSGYNQSLIFQNDSLYLTDDNSTLQIKIPLSDSIAQIRSEIPDVSGFVEYSDSNIVFVTPQQLSDSLALIPDSLITGSGVAGYLPQYTGANTLDTTGVFWDAVNGRLGVRNVVPAATVHITGSGSTSATTALRVENSNGDPVITALDNRNTYLGQNAEIGVVGSVGGYLALRGKYINTSTTLDISPGGSNPFIRSTGANSFTFMNNSGILFENVAGTTQYAFFKSNGGLGVGDYAAYPNINYIPAKSFAATGIGYFGPATSSFEASSILELRSTTKGFLPPRMTTAQRDAIASPATGLMVYDTTVNKVSVHNGTEWKYLAYE